MKPGDINEDGLEIEQDGDITRKNQLRSYESKRISETVRICSLRSTTGAEDVRAGDGTD